MLTLPPAAELAEALLLNKEQRLIRICNQPLRSPP